MVSKRMDSALSEKAFILICLVCLLAIPSQARYIRAFNLVNRKTGKCLSVPGSLNEGVRPMSAPCLEGSKRQMWYKQAVNGQHMFQNRKSRYCLKRRVVGMGINTADPLLMATCDVKDKALLWEVPENIFTVKDVVRTITAPIDAVQLSFCLADRMDTGLELTRCWPVVHDAVIDVAKWILRPVDDVYAGPGPNGIAPGDYLRLGQKLAAPGGRYVMTFASPNIYVTDYVRSISLWNLGPFQGVNWFYFAFNGTAVLCKVNKDTKSVSELWRSAVTPDVTLSTRLVLEADGRLRAYKDKNLKSAYWEYGGKIESIHGILSEYTNIGPAMFPGQVMYPGQVMKSAVNKASLALQFDGNLVLYREEKIVWESNTKTGDATVMVFEEATIRLYTDDFLRTKIFEFGIGTGPGKNLTIDGNYDRRTRGYGVLVCYRYSQARGSPEEAWRLPQGNLAVP